MLVFHLVSAMHFTHFCAQVAATYILVVFSGLQNRLYTHYAFSFHFSMFAIAVENLPVAA